MKRLMTWRMAPDNCAPGMGKAKARLRGKPIRGKQPTPKPKARQKFVGQGGVKH